MLSSLGRENYPTLVEMEVNHPQALLYRHRGGGGEEEREVEEEEEEEVEEGGGEEVEGVEEWGLLLVWAVEVDSFLRPD